MPLPPALLQRLANRGIVKKSRTTKRTPRTADATKIDENEEIIAEDYDDVEDPSQYDFEPVKKPQENFWIERMKRRIGETNLSGYKGCPNKYNIYHKCTVFCISHWGDGVLEPKRSYLRRRNRILKKYPLPKNWLEIYDYGSGIYYYWNTTNDMVSWLPPGHPKSEVSKSAAGLRREMEEKQTDELMEVQEISEQMLSDVHKILEFHIPTPTRRPKSPVSPPPPAPPVATAVPISPSSHIATPKKQKSRDLDKALRHKHSRKLSTIRSSASTTGSSHQTINENDLDPMDPAAYSDIPRGKWSDGLIGSDRAKSGADSTAPGALFQMRPYPSPGTVLKNNLEKGNG